MKRGWGVFALLAVFLPGAPVAAGGLETVAGWEGYGGQGYVFLSPVVSLGSEKPWSAIVSGSVSYLYYRFPDVGGETKVTSPGGALAVGVRVGTGRLTSTFTVGYEVRDTRRRLGGGADTTVREKGVALQGSAFFQAGPLTNLSLIASYGDANQYVWSRAACKQQVTNTDFRGPSALSLGLELTGQGNHDIRAYGAGTVVEMSFFGAHTSVQLRGGINRSSYAAGASMTNGYGGVGFYKRF